MIRLISRKISSRVPYTQKNGRRIPRELFSRVHKEFQRLGHLSLRLRQKIERDYKKIVEKPLPAIPKSHIDTNFLMWSVLPKAELPHKGERVTLLNDKSILLTAARVLEEEGESPPKKNDTVCIFEGCDVGDYLIPFLRQAKPNSPEVILVNGSKRKLSLAKAVASQFVPASQVHIERINSFCSLPQSLKEIDPGKRKIFLPFRLMSVTRYRVAESFLIDRFACMKEDDLLVASFLEKHLITQKTLEGFHRYTPSFMKGDEIVTFEKKANISQRVLDRHDIPRSNVDQIITLTTYSQKALETLVYQSGGRIMYLAQIFAHDDYGKPLQMLGVIAKKRNRG